MFRIFSFDSELNAMLLKLIGKSLVEAKMHHDF